MIVVGGEALVDLVGKGDSRHPVAGGGPFNTAVALGRLGVPVAFFGAVASDEYGQLLSDALGDAGVDTSLVRRSEFPTPLATVHSDDGRDSYTFSLAGTAFTDLSPAMLPALPEAAWGIHLGTLALALNPPADAYEALVGREAGKRQVILDPNVRPTIFGDTAGYRRRFERLAKLADIVKLSEDDAAWIYPNWSCKKVLNRILDLGPRLVAITHGGNGAVARSTISAVDVPGIAVEVVDTVGAGDSFGAGLIAALIDQRALGPDADRELDEDVLRPAVEYAVAASALTCTRAGAVSPTRAEIDQQVRQARLIRAPDR
jgi:fructokinase